MSYSLQGRGSALFFTSLGHFANDGVFLLFTMLVVYYTEIGIWIALLGALGIAYNIISGLVSPKIGGFVGRSDRASYISLGIALEGLAIVFFAASFSLHSYLYPLLLLGVIALGTGQAFYHPIGSSVLVHTYGKKAPTVIGVNGAVGSVGRFLFPTFITLAVAVLGLSLGLGTIAVAMFAIAAALYIGLSAFRQSNYRRDAAAPVEKIDYKSTLRNYSGFINALTAVTFLRGMLLIGTTTFIGKYVFDIFKSNAIVGLFLTVTFIPAVFGQFVFGRLTEKKGGLYANALTTVLAVPLFASFLLVRNLWVLIGIYALYAFFAYTGFPTILGYIGQIIPTRHVTAIGAKVWGVGMVLGGATGTAVATLLLYFGMGVGEMMWLLLASGVAAIAMLPMLAKRNKR